MTEPRLATSILIGALRQRAEAQGGFATVLAKGDPTSGAVLVVLAEQGGEERIMERILQLDGRYSWLQVGNSGAANDPNPEKFLERRRKYDPDLWIIELNIASAERFTAELNGFV